MDLKINYILAQNGLQIVWNSLCLLVLWEKQHPEDFHLESQQIQTEMLWQLEVRHISQQSLLASEYSTFRQSELCRLHKCI